jgi:hypothetical protein
MPRASNADATRAASATSCALADTSTADFEGTLALYDADQVEEKRERGTADRSASGHETV